MLSAGTKAIKLDILQLAAYVPSAGSRKDNEEPPNERSTGKEVVLYDACSIVREKE